MAIDKATADREDFAVGDTIQVSPTRARSTFTITALVGLGDSDGFAGATLAAWDVATAQQVTGAVDQFDAVDVAVDESADPAAVQTRIEEMLPAAPRSSPASADRREQAQLDTFIGTVPQRPARFAFVTAFVSAFLINNVFQITIGQRLRELALMRAVGAAGNQVRRMIYIEALVMAVVATVARHRRRHRSSPGASLPCSTPRAPASPTRRPCCCRGR